MVVVTILSQESLKKIENLYKKKGYYNIVADLNVETDLLLREVDVTINISENKRVFVKEISFTGNAHVNSKSLKKQMETKEKWFFGSGFFNKEILDADKDKVANYYRNNGYINVKIGAPVITYGKNKMFVYIEIPIQEGAQFSTGLVEVEGNELFPLAEIREVLALKEGDIFNQEKMIRDEANIYNYYKERGYIFAIVQTSTYINTNLNVVDISYAITENELAYIEKIIIQGNTRTKDKVIRRNLLVHPLDPFDGKKLRRSSEKLYNLNYFEAIEFETAPGSKSNFRDLIVNVKEKKTGEFSFGGGYSSLDGMIGFVEVSQNNFDIMNFPSFIGAGQKMRLRTEFGAKKTSYELSFTEPWLFDTPLLFGFDIFDKKYERIDYDEGRRGFDIRFGHPIGEDNYASLMFKTERVDIDITDRVNIDAEILAEEGKTTVNSMLTTVTRDTRDSVTFPTRGYKYLLSVEPMGGLLGRDVDIIKYFVMANHFHEIAWKGWVLEGKGRMGSIDKYDDTNRVPIFERFYAGGGSTIRGYKEREVGPKGSDLDPLGGSSLLVFNAELTFPVFNPIRGAVFADAGNVWTGANDWDLGELKKGVGFGLRIKTPFGPVKIDYGFALNNEDYEDDSRLHFSMGGFF